MGALVEYFGMVIHFETCRCRTWSDRMRATISKLIGLIGLIGLIVLINRVNRVHGVHRVNKVNRVN